jgi:hypothetical protein
MIMLGVKQSSFTEQQEVLHCEAASFSVVLRAHTEVRERLYDGEEEGARCCRADGITRKNCRKSGDYKHFGLAWGCVGILKGI